MIAKDFILQEIKRTAKANSDIPLGRNRFLKETGIRPSDWEGKYWTKWSDAVSEAGYYPNKMQSAYDKEFIIRQVVLLIRENQKLPTPAEIKLKAYNLKSFPSVNTIRQRLGNKEELCEVIIDYCKGQPEYSDVVEICRNTKELAPESIDQHLIKKAEDDFGCVYLMKSGRHYKIGHSNHPGRRNYELSSILPQSVKIIHVINTDDPVGIEDYWHRRFMDKKVRNEWFDLSHDDLSAFKRRKFM